jgi:hypothetical protein
MAMAMMRIREVRVRMSQGFMTMPVAMPRAWGHWMIMLMLVVDIVDMLMLMFHRFVRVFVAVLLGEV